MPSVTDVHQQSSSLSATTTTMTTHGKSTPPPQQQQTNSLSTDGNSFDGLTQSILALEKKQRNLGKRKEKLEGYEQEAKKGTELNKDQREALAKYPEVIGQIECVKDIIEQFKKIQADSIKNQKRLSKQMAEEKRAQISQRMNEYAQLRYLLDHRPQTLKSEESILFDELSRLIVPTDNCPTTISRSVDTVLAIYHGGPFVSTIKQITGKNPQELREILESFIKDSQNQLNNQQSTEQQQQQTTKEQQQQIEQKGKEEEEEEEEEETEMEQNKRIDEINNEVPLNNVNEEDLTHRNYSDYPLQFDTRNQKILLEQMMENSPFFSDDLKKNSISQENFLQSTNEQQQQQQQQYLSTHSNDECSTLISPSDKTQQSNEDQWQHTRSNANHPRNNQTNRGHYHPRSSYSNQQQWRGSTRGTRYHSSHPSSAPSGHQQIRPYNDNGNRSRPGTNPNYRGNRGGNYRGGYRGGNGNGNSHYQGNGNGNPNGNYSRGNSSQQNLDQHRPVVSSVNSISS